MDEIKNDLLKLKEEYNILYEEKEKYYKYFITTFKLLNEYNPDVHFNEELSNDLKTIIKISKNMELDYNIIDKFNENILKDETFVKEVLLKDTNYNFKFLPIEYRSDIIIIDNAINFDYENIQYAIFNDIKELKTLLKKYPRIFICLDEETINKLLI